MHYSVQCETYIDGKPCKFSKYSQTVLTTLAKPGTKGFVNPLKNCLTGFGVPKMFTSELDGRVYTTKVTVTDSSKRVVCEMFY